MKIRIREIAEWGIGPDTSPEQAHHYRLTNVLLILFCCAGVFQTAVTFIVGAIDAAIINATSPLTFGIGLYLMKSGRTVLARLFVLIVSYCAAFVMVSALGAESYFQFIFLFASAFSIAFFSVEERKFLIFGLVTPLICFALLEYRQYEPVFGMTRAPLTESESKLLKMASSFIIWALMVFHFTYLTRGRRRLQEQLVSSAKMVGMGRMAAGIAHEVNNPLQLIVSHAERLNILASSSNLNPQAIENSSDQIQAVAMRIASIVKGLLAMSRDVSGDPFKDVQVHSILKMSLDYCKARLESRSIQLTVGLIPEEWTVRCRATQISEVILNVVHNAVDAVSNSDKKSIKIEAVANERFIDLSIEDSGRGVDPKIAHRIFDPFFTTKQVGHGTGLGLSISHGIMSAHAGQIFLDQNSASGAKFVIRLPRGVDVNQLLVTRKL